MLKNVESSALLRLLDVQSEDTAISRLKHRRDNLPEAQRLAQVSASLEELSADLEIAVKQRDELAREQDRLEGEIGLADQKIKREEHRLFSGGVSNPKELSSLQAEVAMLKRKRSELEDALLEVMVQKDQASETVEALRREHHTAATESEQLRSAVDGLVGEIDRELKAHSEARAGLAGAVPQDVLSLYESLRDGKGGVGAAALQDGTCQGCHTKLPSREVERLKAEGGLQRCDNCRRILVVV